MSENLGPDDMKTGLCGCFEDLCGCLFSCLCLPCSVGSNFAKATNHPVNTCDVCFVCSPYVTRTHLRRKYRMESSPCYDAWSCICCSELMAAQNRREMARREKDPEAQQRLAAIQASIPKEATYLQDDHHTNLFGCVMDPIWFVIALALDIWSSEWGYYVGSKCVHGYAMARYQERPWSVCDCWLAPTPYAMRVMVRDEYGIQQNSCKDCCWGQCCSACSAIQMKREVAYQIKRREELAAQQKQQQQQQSQQQQNLAAQGYAQPQMQPSGYVDPSQAYGQPQVIAQPQVVYVQPPQQHL